VHPQVDVQPPNPLQSTSTIYENRLLCLFCRVLILFESVLRYDLIVWGNGTGIEKMLLLQNSIRILTNSHPLEHCKPLFVDTGILTVINLYIYNILVKEEYFNYDLRGQSYEYNIGSKNILNTCRLSKTMNYHLTLSVKLFKRLPVANA
jgi:hypothetical protein